MTQKLMLRFISQFFATACCRFVLRFAVSNCILYPMKQSLSRNRRNKAGSFAWLALSVLQTYLASALVVSSLDEFVIYTLVKLTWVFG
jgi:hypothetical protein